MVSVFWTLGRVIAQPSEFHGEPMYKGMPLSFWVEAFDGPTWSSDLIPEIKDIKGGPAAQEAVVHIGTNAIPFLIHWIGGEPISATDLSKLIARDLFLPSFQHEPPDAGRAYVHAVGALQAFRVLGPAARSAVPALASLITNQFGAGAHSSAIDQGDVQPPGAFWVLQALGAIGPESLPVLFTIATNRAYTHMTRVIALGAARAAAGTNEQAVLPVLLQCAEENDEEVDRGAVGVLSTCGQHDQRVFVALTNALQHPALGVRRSAIDALPPFGSQALPALLPVLLRMFDDTNDGMRYIALNALIRTEPQALTNSAVLAMMAEGLRSEDSKKKFWAAKVLRLAGQQASGKGRKPSIADLDLAGTFQEATNTLRQLAPQLLDGTP